MEHLQRHHFIRRGCEPRTGNAQPHHQPRNDQAQRQFETLMRSHSPRAFGQPDWNTLFKTRDQTLLGAGVRYAVVDRVIFQQRVAGEIHLRDQSRQHAGAKQREVDMRRAPRVVVVAPRVGAGLDGLELVPAVGAMYCIKPRVV